jgi:pantoate--beta-alanine ligase
MRMSPRILSLPADFREACDVARRESGRPVGFVPTMGALHEGHLALVREAKRRAPFVAVSIFVNPTQFGPNEDYGRYPRDLASDVAKLATVGADAVFSPEPGAMYPKGEETRVQVGALAAPLCGRFRPGHFEGVATVVSKLFALAGPSVAVFGKKDYQQLAILRRLATDLFFPVEVVGHPIVREGDGLALSSRNAYLSTADRQRALALSRGLTAAWRAFDGGERKASRLRSLVRAEVERGADSIDYVEVADADSLAPFEGETSVAGGGGPSARALVAIACRIGGTRLIDNVVLGEDPIPAAGAGANAS